MNFVTIQEDVRTVIATHATFTALAATTVFADLGNLADIIEDAIADIAARGYAVTVWPPIKGMSDEETAGVSGVYTSIVVRFSVNPQKLIAVQALHDANGANPSAALWVGTRVKDIIQAVLGKVEEVGGARFELTQDSFELVNFDEGLLAYHIRFARHAVF